MKAMKEVVEKKIVKNHPYIKDVLVYDIETDSLNVNTAKMVWFGAYSFKHEKYFIATPDDRALIQQLISDHKVLVGWNSKSFDGPIMENEINNYNVDYKIIFDGMRVLYNPEKRKDNRKPIIQLKDGQHLDAACKSNKLKDIGKILGCKVEKGDIDYKIFRKTSWTKEEIKEIEHYLYKDVALTKEIFEFYLEYFDSFKEMVGDEDVRKFNYIRSSTGSFAYSAISKAVGKDPIYPKNDRNYSRNKFEGGFVLEPQKEYAEDVIYFDFASLYPMSYIQCNLFSPVKPEDNVKTWNGDGFFNVEGIYKADKRGVMEEKLAKIYKTRKELKDNNNPTQLAYKVILNSIYGISSVPIFMNVYNPTCASDCTSIGRDCIKYSIKTFEDNGFSVIAADTDSCFVKLGSKSKEDAVKIANEITETLQSHMPFPF